MLFFGFSAGIPLLLIFSSLGLWLREAGINRSTVTFFSWAALAYSFKFIWAPVVDQLPVPILTKALGKRRAWILVSQFAIIMAILLMAFTNPALSAGHLQFMALACAMLGFSSATQDIVIDAYRIEIAPAELQALMSSTYIAGYRIGMLVSGAGSLFIAGSLGTEMNNYNYSAWQYTYGIMAMTMIIGVFTTLMVKEPDINKKREYIYSNITYIKFFIVFVLSILGFIFSYQLNSEIAFNWKNNLSVYFNNAVFSNFCIEFLRLSFGVFVSYLIAMLAVTIKFIDKAILIKSYINPVIEFFNRYGIKIALLLLVLIGLYRISDIVLGVIANIFYQDIGYSKKEIASIVKTFGLIMTLLGGFLGGILSLRYGVMKILFLGALLTVITNLLFMLLAIHGYDITLLYIVISADNLSAGIASAAFVAFLSKLTNISFTAMQYAIFSSLMTLIPKIIGGYSGSIVENVGYINFFLFASLLGVPVLIIIYAANKYLKFE